MVLRAPLGPVAYEHAEGPLLTVWADGSGTAGAKCLLAMKVQSWKAPSLGGPLLWTGR